SNHDPSFKTGCPDLFDPQVLPSYSIDIDDVAWAGITAEFNDLAPVLAGTPRDTYFPVVFHFGDEVVTDAAIRLKGQSSWVSTIHHDANPKMQFVVAFDQFNPKGKFHGISKLHFDMTRSDWTFLNERLANTWLRQVGIAAPCTNNAKLFINGAYYGLYATEESKGAHLFKTFFPNNPDGDLWKGGVDPEAGKNEPNWERQKQFWKAMDITAMSQIVDLPTAVTAWASEAVLNDGDGYYGGAHNFLLYDQGAAGFAFVPTDLDSTIEWMTVNTSIGIRQHPIFWWANRPGMNTPGQHYLLVMNDPTWRARYVEAIAAQLAKWDPLQMQGLIDAWSAQIAEAIALDPHKAATPEQVQTAIAAARDGVAGRATFLQSFVECERGQPAADNDGDGVPWCNDCNDEAASVLPGAVDACGNGIDDNCNGVVDENCSGQPAAPAAASGTTP
ncbi:MAG TPA: CotH kinase family protein, partial [Polyangia bacterium]|nr:CotH kinase family protein [Polyangia bacterium]